jgi:hypothetical protein
LHAGRLFARKPSQWPRYAAGRSMAVGRRLYGTLWRLMYKSYKVTSKVASKTPNKKPPGLLQNLKRVYHFAGVEYVPKVYPGKLVLFRAREHSASILYDPNKGWAGLPTGGLEIIDVPGDHNSMLKNDADVRVLAQEVNQCLARAHNAAAGNRKPMNRAMAAAADRA